MRSGAGYALSLFIFHLSPFTLSQRLLKPNFARPRNISELALLAGAAIAEALIEAMRVEEARIRPEHHALGAAGARLALGEIDEPRRKAAPSQILPDIDAVQLREAGLWEVDTDACPDAAAAILDNEEAPSPLGAAHLRPQQVTQIVMRVDIATRILRKAQSDEAEELLRVGVARRPDQEIRHGILAGLRYGSAERRRQFSPLPVPVAAASRSAKYAMVRE